MVWKKKPGTIATSSARLYSLNYSSEGSDNRIQLLGLLMHIYGEDNTAWYKITTEVHLIPESEGEKQEPGVRSGENSDQVTWCGQVSAGAPVHLGSSRCFAVEQGTKLVVSTLWMGTNQTIGCDAIQCDVIWYNTIRYDTIWEFVWDSSAAHIYFTYMNAIKASENMAHLLQCSYQDSSTQFPQHYGNHNDLFMSSWDYNPK